MTPVALSAAIARYTDQLSEGRLAVAASTRDQIGASLEPLYRAAESSGDQQHMALIAGAWEQTQSLYREAEQLQNLAAGAMTVALAAKTDRDALAAQVSEIEDAIESLKVYGSSTHPLLSEVPGELEAHWAGDRLVLECPGCAAMDNGWEDYGLDHDVVHDVVNALFINDPSKLPHDLRLDFVAALTNWSERYAEWLSDFADNFVTPDNIDQFEDKEIYS